MLSLCEGTLWATEALHVGAGVSSCCLRLSSSVVGQTLLRRSVGSFSLSIKVKCDTHIHILSLFLVVPPQRGLEERLKP